MRGPWLTSIFGVVLLVGIPIEFVTGLLSYAAYNPRLGNPPNSAKGVFGLYLFNWVTKPSWLYRVTESTHVFLGLVLVPVVLAKLWSVMPKLFEWPPWRSVAQLLERLSLALVVGGIVFEMVTGILNINYFTQINFYSGHFYGAWAFIAGFAVHVGVKFGDMVRALRSRSLRTELQDRTGRHPARDGRQRPRRARTGTTDHLPAGGPRPGRRHLVRRLRADRRGDDRRRHAPVRPLRDPLPVPGPRGQPLPGQPHLCRSTGITASRTGPDWRLSLVGARHVSLSRDQLLAMPLTTADLPIACTEGWSTQQRWTGVPLADLARLAGSEHPARHRSSRSTAGRSFFRGRRCRRLIPCSPSGSTAPTSHSTTGTRPGSSSRPLRAPIISSG